MIPVPYSSAELCGHIFFGIMLAYPKLSMYFYGLKLKTDVIKRDGEKENRAWGYPPLVTLMGSTYYK